MHPESRTHDAELALLALLGKSERRQSSSDLHLLHPVGNTYVKDRVSDLTGSDLSNLHWLECLMNGIDHRIRDGEQGVPLFGLSAFDLVKREGFDTQLLEPSVRSSPNRIAVVSDEWDIESPTFSYRLGLHHPEATLLIAVAE